MFAKPTIASNEKEKKVKRTHFSQAAKCPPWSWDLWNFMGCSFFIHQGGVITIAFGKQLSPIGTGEYFSLNMGSETPSL